MDSRRRSLKSPAAQGWSGGGGTAGTSTRRPAAPGRPQRVAARGAAAGAAAPFGLPAAALLSCTTIPAAAGGHGRQVGKRAGRVGDATGSGVHCTAVQCGARQRGQHPVQRPHNRLLQRGNSPAGLPAGSHLECKDGEDEGAASVVCCRMPCSCPALPQQAPQPGPALRPPHPTEPLRAALQPVTALLHLQQEVGCEGGRA